MKAYDKTKLGPNLKALRKISGLTPKQVADAIGLERTSVTNIEAGRQPATDVLVAKFAEACGYEVRLSFVKISERPASKEESK